MCLEHSVSLQAGGGANSRSSPRAAGLTNWRAEIGGINCGLQAFLATYESFSSAVPYSSSSMLSRNQRQSPSLKGVTS